MPYLNENKDGRPQAGFWAGVRFDWVFLDIVCGRLR